MVAPADGAAPPPRVLKDYVIRELIGHGGTSTVYRALHMPSQSLVAVKVVPIDWSSLSEEVQTKGKAVKREYRIHETLKHENILELLGVDLRSDSGRGWPSGAYMVLYLAEAGDLFDKITPDFGVEEDIAHLYFRQLIDGLRYLGKQGICHRDIKPENCLLDGRGNLKIADFGLATVFKYKGVSRLLRDRCGSPPYAAPELAHVAPYAGEPIDIWSAGILLFTLLVGNTPWDQPTSSSPEFRAFLSKEILSVEPWSKIGGSATDLLALNPETKIQALLLRLLEVNPEERITISQLENMDWYRQSNPLIGPDGQCSDGFAIARRLTESLHRHGYLDAPSEAFDDVMDLTSQRDGPSLTQQLLSQRGLNPQASFQSSLKLYSQLSMAPSQRTNPNLTRFFSTLPLPSLSQVIIQTLKKLFITFLEDLEPTKPYVARIKIQTKDKRGEKLSGAIVLTDSLLPGGASYSNVARGDMEVDAEDDEIDRKDWTKGYDVVLLKKEADPLELKRLWMMIVRSLPGGVVYAT